MHENQGEKYNIPTEPSNPLSDEALLDLISAGNETAYNMLIQRYVSKIWRLSFSILKNEQEAEDATQDVFLSLWQNIKKWDKNGSAKFSTWIYRITFNKCIDIKRKKSPLTTGDEFEIDSGELSAYHMTFEKEVSHKLSSILSGLPKHQKEAIKLYYFNEMSALEVADTMKKSEQSVRSLLKRARASLKETLKQDPHIAAWVPQSFIENINKEKAL